MQGKLVIIVSLILLCGGIHLTGGFAMGEKKDFKMSIKAKLEKVNILDGVNKEEAIIIAQSYIIDNGQDDFLIVSKPKIFDKHVYGDNYWLVSFSTKFSVKVKQGILWGAVLVNKETGEVEHIGCGPDL